MSDAAEVQRRPRAVVVGLVLIGALSVFLRLWPIEHGAPRPEYVPDTHIVRNALHMLSERDPVPPANAYSSYPYLLSFTLVPVYAGDFALGVLRDDWEGAAEYGTLLKENPWHAHLLARIVLALIAATAPLFVLLAARAAGMGIGAYVAAFLAATSLLHVQLSLQERPWAPLAAAVAATAYGAAVHATRGSRSSLLWTGVAAGAAFSIHQSGGLALGMAAIAWLVAPAFDDAGNALGWSWPGVRRRVLRGVLCVTLFAFVSLLFGHPYLIAYGATDPSQVAAQELLRPGQRYFTLGGQIIVLELRWETLVGYVRSFFGYDPIVLLFGALGLMPALRRRALLPAMVFVLGWGAFFMTNLNEHIRYLVPMVMLMTLPAGLVLGRLARHPVGAVVTGLALALPLVQAVRLGWVLRQPDTRAIAASQLASLPADARVAIDMYGPVVPQTLDALERTAELRILRGETLYGREEHRRAMLQADAPQAPGLDVIRLEDVFEYDLRSRETWIRESLVESLGATAEEVLESLDVTHVLLVDRTPDDDVPPPLVDPAEPTSEARDDGPPRKLSPLELPDGNVWTIHPSWSEPTSSVDGEAVDAHLPTAMAFPLRDLWAVRRPGPKLQLFELATD